jgi:hypothetical protein
VSPFEHRHFFAKLEGTDSDLDKILHICSDLNIWAYKIYNLEANIKTLNGRNFFIFKDTDVTSKMSCSKWAHPFQDQKYDLRF